ncbi:hypothetical protein [Streptomyces sp. NPDC014995]|uniref:hypothetical protein n=1 Tax=Streptomyces sp. NPDC014995 TaxID=3364936 RepID=UPI0036FAC8EF
MTARKRQHERQHRSEREKDDKGSREKDYRKEHEGRESADGRAEPEAGEAAGDGGEAGDGGDGADRGEAGDGGDRWDGGEGRAGAQPSRTHLSAAGLRARGWTADMMRQLLGEPDLFGVDARFRSAPRTRLYLVERVEAAERSDEFRAVAAAAARRSGAAKAADRRRRREVLGRIAAEPLDVPRLAPDRLAALAVEHHRRREAERAHGRWGPPVADPAAPIDGADAEVDAEVDARTLQRWKVEYLRHRLARYVDVLDELYGRTGRAAEELLRRRVYAAIAGAYPDLAGECERRLREREWGPPRA